MNISYICHYGSHDSYGTYVMFPRLKCVGSFRAVNLAGSESLDESKSTAPTCHCHVWMEPDRGLFCRRSHSIHFPSFWITFCRFLQDLFGSVGSTASILWCWTTFLETWDHDFPPLQQQRHVQTTRPSFNANPPHKASNQISHSTINSWNLEKVQGAIKVALKSLSHPKLIQSKYQRSFRSSGM